MTGNPLPPGLDKNLTQPDIDFALQAAGLGVWALNPVTNVVNGDARCRQLLGLTTDIAYEQVRQHIHAGDRARVDKAVQWATTAASDGRFDETCRTIGATDGLLRWVRFTGKASFDDAGRLIRFAGIAQEVTEDVQTVERKALDKVAVSEQRFQNLVRDASVGIIVLSGDDMRIEVVNDAYAQLIGRSSQDLLGNHLFAVIPEAEASFRPIIARVRASGEPHYLYGQPYVVHAENAKKEGYLNLVYQPYREQDGTITGVIVLCQDVTRQKKAEEALQVSEARFRQLVQQAPAAIVVVTGKDLVIETVNQAMLTRMGWGEDIIGQPLEVALPDVAGQGLPLRCRQVFQTGTPIYSWGDAVRIHRKGRLETGYYNVAYTPLYEGETITGVMQVATDVTEQVLARKLMEASEARIRGLVASAPFPIGVYVGREMRIQLANQSILDIWGKGNEVIGKLYSDVLPELENQAIFTQLDGVYTTGLPFHANDQRVDLLVNGQLKSYYFNYNFTPLCDADGRVYGVMNTAADVTALALAKRQVEETEASLRGAIELARLGTWALDAETGQIHYSDRIRSWFGFSTNTQTLDTVFNPIHPKDRSRVEAAVQRALQPGGSGQFEEEFTLVHIQTGAERVVHAQGLTTFDALGNPVRIRGTAQDVTKQRELQKELEQQVQERTEELAAANEELAAANEELAATNEELAANNEEYAAINEELMLANQDTAKVNEELMESTSLLMRSNENLQRFAYVASHDLQEPLRKIQQFGDLLRNRYGDQLGDGVDYLERMQSAATRMSALIRDLLDFSRIATQRDSNQAVSLTDLVNGVLADLELTIQETGADISAGPLPEVFGDASQLKQLFQNLLSNALKFRRPGVLPRVQVYADWVGAEELPHDVRPARSALSYHRIDVVDNGIGFDEKYLDRIFQVFQRLHGKSEYAGTGIGLAICEKVVTNHGGGITASSQPGQGARFSIYLPNTFG